MTMNKGTFKLNYDSEHGWGKATKKYKLYSNRAASR